MPVTLPPVTIMRCDSSLIFSPSGARSSCAIRSKRGSVVPNCACRFVRTRVLDLVRAGEQPQPQPQRQVMIVVDAGFRVGAGCHDFQR